MVRVKRAALAASLLLLVIAPVRVPALAQTFDYDAIYGRNPGAPDRFVEQVYRSLRD